MNTNTNTQSVAFVHFDESATQEVAYCGAEGELSERRKDVDCPECLAMMADD